MTITVEDRPNALLELLWIREAYGLRLVGDHLPPPLVDSPPAVTGGTSTPATRGAWEEAWPRIWDGAAAHAGAEADPSQFERLGLTGPGSIERAELLRRMVGPTWRDEFGDDAFADDSYNRWLQIGMDAHLAKLPISLEDHPERRDLAVLIPAWRAGLTKVVTIPCAGEYVHRVGAHGLLMTDGTREDSDAYRRALRSFA
ncbi:hypothetical protein [Micromonospora sp. DT81.3]